MKKFLTLLSIILAISLLVPWPVWSRDWELTIEKWGFERKVIMRPRYDYDPTHQYRGTWEKDGTMNLRPRFNYDLRNRLRGYVDPNGYGRLRDWNGNVFKIKPRY